MERLGVIAELAAPISGLSPPDGSATRSVLFVVPVALVSAESVNAPARSEPGLMVLVLEGHGRVRAGDVGWRCQVPMPRGAPGIGHWVDAEAPRRTWVGSVRRRR